MPGLDMGPGTKVYVSSQKLLFMNEENPPFPIWLMLPSYLA